MPEPLCIVGSSVASLVAALTAARHGRHVTLHFDPARLGGSFAGVPCGPRRLDLGSRLFELDYEDPQPRALDTYDPATDTHRPFIGQIAGFIRDLMGAALRPATTPEMWIAGRRIRCPLMTVDLADLPSSLPRDLRDAIRLDASRIENDPAPPRAGDETLGVASLAQHGPHLHRVLIEAIAAKQHPDWSGVLAAERRKIWAALFHPRTVLQAFSGQPITFHPHRPFTTTIEGQVNGFVDRLFAAVSHCRTITCVPAGPLAHLSPIPRRRLRLRFADNSTVEIDRARCAIGAPPEQVFRSAGLVWDVPCLHTAIIWMQASPDHVRQPCSSMLVADPDIPAVRISSAGLGTYAVEFGAQTATPALAADALRRTGIVSATSRLTALHALSARAQVLPTQASRDRFDAALAKLGDVAGTLLAGARRFGFDSLNDQIIDALHFGALRC